MKDKIYGVIFTCIVLLILGINVNVKGDFESNLNEEESKLSQKEEMLSEIQNQLEKLNASKNDLDVYLDNLSDSYDAIAAYMEGIDEEIYDMQKQIDNINAELDKAEENRKTQYDAMKQRIKYMYETGDTEWIFALFSDKSINDILNRVEYVAKLVEYDREKLKEYEEILIYVEATRIELEKEKNHLLALKGEQEAKKKEMSKLMSEAAVNIRTQEEKIDEAESEARVLMEQIEENKNSIEELKAEESRRIEESIRASIELESKQNAGIYEEATTAKPYEASEEDVMKMAAILYCEARGEPYQGILAVGSVIMNRIDDPRFPNTLEEVIMSPKQFSPVASGLYAIALAKGANEQCIQAAKEVLFDGVRIGPWLYFRTVNNIIQGTIIGNHVFYYR